MERLTSTRHGVAVQRVTPGRYIAYLPGPNGATRGRLRLVGGDHAAYADQVVRAIERAVDGDTGAHVMLVGAGAGRGHRGRGRGVRRLRRRSWSTR